MKTCIICKKRQKQIFTYQNYFYYRCTKCELVSTYPLPTLAVIKKHYQERFERGNYFFLRKYAKYYKFIYQGFVDKLDERLTKNGHMLKGKKVLDIGCFTGDFIYLLNKKGADVYGLELQEDAVKIASKKLPGKILQGDIDTYIFPKNERYDIITLLGVVEHVPDPMKLITKSSKLLKKGGILMIQTPNSTSFLARMLGKFWPPYSPVEHIHLFSKKSLLLALKTAGFKQSEFTAHWKNLPIGYVYNMFHNFGPEFYRLLKPLRSILNRSSLVLPFYVGEMIIIASKEK